MKPSNTKPRPRTDRSLQLVFAALLLAAAGPQAALAQASAAPGASAPQSREQVERRWLSTGALVSQSSGARQIEASGNVDAKVQLAKARELHAQAKVMLDGGDVETANKLLHASARTMMEAVGMASAEQVNARKDKVDYDARRESTRALLDAGQRIAVEKGAGPRNAELMKRIDATIAEADRLAAAGRLPEARRTLDQAYGAARAAVNGMRGGETLVRSLNFANKEEEFHYEIDRNDTHRMLVTLLLQDRRSAGSIDAMVERALEASSKLRKVADEQAQRREFDAGVKSLEDSTRELQRAIRAAGVYIPG
jgi:hypothetical protein